MDYMCGHYWNREGEVSLVLKHLLFRQGEMPAIFACMAEGDTRNAFMEEMTDWFHKKAVPCCNKGEQGIKTLACDLERWAEKQSHSLKAAAVLFCVGEVFLLWRKGKQKIWFINTCFGKPHYRSLFSEDTQGYGEFLCGELESGVGILLATEDFGEGISMQQLAACLALKALDKETKLEKRLKELGEESIRKGKEHAAAVLVVTCE